MAGRERSCRGDNYSGWRTQGVESTLTIFLARSPEAPKTVSTKCHQEPRHERSYVEHQPHARDTDAKFDWRHPFIPSKHCKRKKRNQQLTDDETFLLDLPLSLRILLIIVCRHVAEILLVNRADVESSVWVVVRRRKRPSRERSRLQRSSYRFAFKMDR
jgi:hypothetical protein